MNGRKTMKTWQMIVAVVLLAAMLITIFLPAIHLNGKSLRKALEKVVSGEMVDQTAELAGIDMDEIEDNIVRQSKFLVKQAGALSTPELYDNGLMEILIQNGWLTKISKKHKSLVEIFEKHLKWDSKISKWTL